MTKNRVTTDDLRLARDWLNSYNDGEAHDMTPGGEDTIDTAAVTMFKVAEWLQAEINRRDDEEHARKVRSEIRARTGRTLPLRNVKAAIRKVQAGVAERQTQRS